MYYGITVYHHISEVNAFVLWYTKIFFEIRQGAVRLFFLSCNVAGGGGLVPTVDDYFAFARMMLNKGRCGREQLLSRASVELMTSDQLTPQQREGAEIFFGANRSWGFGLAVESKRDELFRTPGRFGWDGGLGTSAYTDPAEGLIGILLTQRMMDSPQAPRVFSDFWALAYEAIK